MKRLLSICLMFSCANTLTVAQTNLVPNPSFEIYSICPAGLAEVFQAIPWYDPTSASSDYFNQCATVSVGVPSNAFGNEGARTGVAYCGFYSFQSLQPDYREYVQVKLSDTLEWGKKYLVSFYISHAENTTFGTNRIGAYFSALPVSNTGPGLVLSYIPQVECDSANPIINNIGWRLIEDTLYSMGGELYLTIGNFYADGNTDTLFVGGPGWGSAYYYLDDVSVIDIGWVGISEDENSIFCLAFPNPTSDNVTLEIRGALPANGEVSIEFYNLIGDVVRTQKLENVQTQEISLPGLNAGIYIYQILQNNQTLFQGKIAVVK